MFIHVISYIFLFFTCFVSSFIRICRCAVLQIMGGPYVAESEQSYKQMNRAWQQVGSAAFWDFRISDEEWTKHIEKLQLQELLQSIR